MAQYVLEILDGDRAGEVLAVADRPLRIGRKPGNDLVLADEKTSGVHAEIVLEGDRHVLRDLGSTNGTFLDGKRITEIVLTPGDVVTVGRLRVKFRDEGEAAKADPGELAVRRLDAGKLGRRGGSAGLLAAALVLALGAGGWFWWQGSQQGDVETPGRTRARAVVVVAGNQLAGPVAGCEGEEGWALRGPGAAWQTTTSSHSGAGAFQVMRGEGDDAPDFAVLRLAEPLPVFALRTMTLAAHVEARGGAQVALRAVFASANEQVPFRFCSGTPLAAVDAWQRIEVVLAVPPGCDRLQLEVVAVLPGAEAVVRVDDVAIVEGGNAAALEVKQADGSQTAIGTGCAVAVRSVDNENPAILLGVLPERVPEALQGLHRADLCVLSDLGQTVVCTPGERGFTLAAAGADSLRFVLPAEAVGGLAIASDDLAFAGTAADSEFLARRVLVGDRLTRAMLQVPAAVTWRGRTGGGRYRLSAPANQVELLLSFRSERQQAGELVRQAGRARDEKRPGEALDHIATLMRTLPMDTEQLGRATALRTEILAQQAATVGALQRDLEEAAFFSTRGGFERVVLGVAELRQLYGDHNLEDPAAVQALQDRAGAQLLAIDGQQRDRERSRLQALAKALGEAQQTGLQTLVEQYVDRQLPAK